MVSPTRNDNHRNQVVSLPLIISTITSKHPRLLGSTSALRNPENDKCARMSEQEQTKAPGAEQLLHWLAPDGLTSYNLYH